MTLPIFRLRNACRNSTSSQKSTGTSGAESSWLRSATTHAEQHGPLLSRAKRMPQRQYRSLFVIVILVVTTSYELQVEILGAATPALYRTVGAQVSAEAEQEASHSDRHNAMRASSNPWRHRV